MKFGLLSYNDPCTGFFWAVKQLGGRATTIFPMRKVPSQGFYFCYSMPPTSICLMVVNCAYVFLWPSWEGIMFNGFRRFEIEKSLLNNTCPP